MPASLAWSCTFIVALLAVSIYDITERRLPNSLALTVLCAGVFYQGAGGFAHLVTGAGGIIAGLISVMAFYYCGWMGAGDVKMLAAFGSFLGVRDTLHAAAIGSILAGVMGLCDLSLRILSRHRHRHRHRRRRPDEFRLGSIQRPATTPLAAAFSGGILVVRAGLDFA